MYYVEDVQKAFFVGPIKGEAFNVGNALFTMKTPFFPCDG